MELARTTCNVRIAVVTCRRTPTPPSVRRSAEEGGGSDKDFTQEEGCRGTSWKEDLAEIEALIASRSLKKSQVIVEVE